MSNADRARARHAQCVLGGVRRRPTLPAALVGGFAALSLSCGGGRRPGVDYDESAHMLGDCPWVADGCKLDGDGCSEKEGHANEASAFAAVARGACDGQLLPQVAADVTGQLIEKPALERVRVQAPSAECARAVVAAIVAFGIEARRLETVIDERARWVSFDVSEWSGTRCDGEPKKAPATAASMTSR